MPVLIIAGIAILGERERIEQDLGARTRQALEQAGYQWAQMSFEGRDGVIGGLAFDESEPDRAAKMAARTYGVRVVRSETKLIDKADRYDWVAVRRESRVRLGGLVPNEKTRREIIGIARATFPSHEIVDRLTLARGAPALDIWLGGVGFGLKQLALLKSGSVRLETTELTVTGEAVDAAGYRAVKTALATGLPPGISLKADKVEAPVVSPYVWSARLTEGLIDMRGSVPSEKVREDLLTLARRAMARAKTADSMMPARGEPDGWEAVVRVLLRELGRLEEGTVELRDHAIVVAGVAIKEATVDDIRLRLKEGVPASYRVVDRMTFREPTIKTVSPYVTTFALEKGVGTLTGYVPSEAARAALSNLLQARLPGLLIVDRLELGAGPTAGWQRCLDVGFNAIARLGNGGFTLSDRRLLVTGATEAEALAKALPNEVRAAANRDCDAEVQIVLKAKPEPMLKWSATIPEQGDLVIEGEVPGGQVRDEILAAAKRLFGARGIIDRMVVVGEASERWQRTALVALNQLARLRLGRASIVNQALTIDGQARDVVAQAAIRDALGRNLPEGYQGQDAIVVRSDAMIAAEQASLRKAEEDERKRVEAAAEAKRRAAEEAQRRTQEEVRREQAERQRALEEAQRIADEVARRQRHAEEIRLHAEEEARRRAAEEAERMRNLATSRRRTDDEARQRAEADARRRGSEDEIRRRVEEAAKQGREAEARRVEQQERARKQAAVDTCTEALKSVTTEGVIQFDWASARLDRRSHPTLMRVAEVAQACPGVTIDIEGHTDAEGTDERNQPLSERRAQAVVDFLAAAGVPPERMKAVGYGSTRPIAPNDSPANRAKNRRIAFTVKAN